MRVIVARIIPASSPPPVPPLLFPLIIASFARCSGSRIELTHSSTTGLLTCLLAWVTDWWGGGGGGGGGKRWVDNGPLNRKPNGARKKRGRK